jgi:hypothetical protein
VFPESGSELRFGPEPFRTGPKSGSKFSIEAEPDRKSGSGFGAPREVVNRVRTEPDLNLVEGRPSTMSTHSLLSNNIAAPPQTSQPLKCHCSNVAAPVPLKHTLKCCPSNGTVSSNVLNLLPLPHLEWCEPTRRWSPFLNTICRSSQEAKRYLDKHLRLDIALQSYMNGRENGTASPASSSPNSELEKVFNKYKGVQ